MRTLEEIEKDLAAAKAEAAERERKLKDERTNVKREQMRKANEEARRLTDELRARLERENGVVGHPKAALLWSKAWEHGHSAGLSEVESWYDDLVELIK